MHIFTKLAQNWFLDIIKITEMFDELKWAEINLCERSYSFLIVH